RHDFQVIWLAAIFEQAAFDIAVKFLCIGQVLLCGKNHFSIFACKFSAIFGLSRLHNHRIALRWARDVEWSLDTKIFALMFWFVNFIGMEKLTTFLVIN